jgi:hypothetical protein
MEDIGRRATDRAPIYDKSMHVIGYGFVGTLGAAVGVAIGIAVAVAL